MINSHIVLLGYMGCGKTTISSKLETILNLPSIDLDQFIENELKMSISQIFNLKVRLNLEKLKIDFLKYY